MSLVLNRHAGESERDQHYQEVAERIEALLSGENDWVAGMATVVCELHHSFEYFDWTGFYRVTEPQLLKIGPYQGGHGCLRIPFEQGVCGAAARTATTQLVDDVNAFAGHIACSASTQSEIVVPITDHQQQVVAVLDCDSDNPSAFQRIDQVHLERLCHRLGELFFAKS
jgi:GAF domain-containing protein